MIDLRIKSLFFDQAKVIDAVGRAKVRMLSRIGAFVRQRAKTSIRKRKGSSAAGEAPHSHAGWLRKFILFGYDRAADAVVVGPAKINRQTDAPHTLEFGGDTVITRRRGGKRGGGKIVRKRVQIAPRPFMGPALEKEAPNMPRQWAGAVKEY